VIFAEDVEKIFGKRPWASRSEEIFDNKGDDAPATEQETTTEEPAVAE
jgi:cell division protease FtsH